MFVRLGRLVTRHPLWVVLAWILLAAVTAGAAMTGFGGEALFRKLETGEPTVPGSQSERVGDLLSNAEEGPTTTLMLSGLDLDSTDSVAAVSAVMADYRTDLLDLEDVVEVLDPFQHPLGPLAPEVAALVSSSQEDVLVRVTLAYRLDRAAEKAAASSLEATLEDLGTTLVADGEATDWGLTSSAILVRAVNHQMEQDLVRGELVALPVSLLVMVIVFGGALAAGMPIVGALASIAGGLGTVWGLSFVLDLDSVVINVVTVLGLGLSIDYGLLMVSRFREELRREVDELDAAVTAGLAVGRRRRGGRRRDPLVIAAARRTVATAGRTVVFSALTIAISVAGLIAMPPSLLKGLGVAGSAVVLIALLSAVTLVPALLVLSGRRLLRPSILSRVPGLRAIVGRLGEISPEHGVFSRLTTWVQRRPWFVLIGAVAVLVVAMLPLGSLHLRNSGIDLLPTSTNERQVWDRVTESFPAFTTADIYVIPDSENASQETVDDVSAALAELAGVESVDEPRELDSGHVLLGVRLDGIEPDSPEAVAVVHAIRDLPDLDLLVGGQAAGQADFTHSLVQGLPVAGGMVVLATFVLLFLMTGSVLVPVKALITNVVSICASLGITTFVFQQGHGAHLLGFESVGGLESYVVAIVVAFGFGLAMDYEVFLLSRIKELYDAGHPNDEAVRLGLQRSGRIITSAALVIIVVFAGFAAGELLPIKEVGFALAVAVALDASLVRMLLVPATMTVLGDANWWAPRWLKPLASRFAITH